MLKEMPSKLSDSEEREAAARASWPEARVALNGELAEQKQHSAKKEEELVAEKERCKGELQVARYAPAELYQPPVKYDDISGIWSKHSVLPRASSN